MKKIVEALGSRQTILMIDTNHVMDEQRLFN